MWAGSAFACSGNARKSCSCAEAPRQAARPSAAATRHRHGAFATALRPNAHKAKASSNAASNATAMDDAPSCLPTTQNSHSAVASIGKASTCRNTAIQGPGFGKAAPREGIHVSAK